MSDIIEAEDCAIACPMRKSLEAEIERLQKFAAAFREFYYATRLRERNDMLEDRLCAAGDLYPSLTAKIAELEAALRMAHSALFNYGDHSDGCAVEQLGDCDCGFIKALDLMLTALNKEQL